MIPFLIRYYLNLIFTYARQYLPSAEDSRVYDENISSFLTNRPGTDLNTVMESGKIR